MCFRRMPTIRCVWEFWGDEIESIQEIDNVTGEKLNEFEHCPFGLRRITLPRARKWTEPFKPFKTSCAIDWRSSKPKASCSRLSAWKMRVNYDLEMLETMGFCSRHRELLEAS